MGEAVVTSPENLKGLSVGRIVHYVNTGSRRHDAAIVTMVHGGNEGSVNLVVFGPSGQWCSYREVLFDEDGRAHSWHWPERE